MNSRLNISRCTIVGLSDAPDRLLASGSLCHVTAIDQPPVLLTYLFEITKPWFPESRLIPGLIDTLNDEYPSLRGDGNLEVQFEALLKRVNQELNQISESGDTDWIGSLNGLITCIFEDQLLFSQTGSCPAYLLQRGKIRQITEEPADEQLHPLKTFANLASGILQAEDRILMANGELYREISLDALRRVVNSDSPYLACQQIVRELKQNRNSSVSASILHILPDATQADAEPQEILLDDIFEHKVKRLRRKAAPVLKAAYLGAQAGVRLADRVTREQLVPRGRSAVERTSTLAKEWQNRRQLRAESSAIEIIRPSMSLKPTRMDGSVIAQLFRNWWSKRINRKVAALALVVILLGLASLSLVSRFRHSDAPASDHSKQIEQVQQLSDKAATAIQQQQSEMALQDLTQARAVLTGVSGSKAETLGATIDTQEDIVTRTTRLSVTATYQLPAPASLLLYAKPYLYAAGASTAALLRIDENPPNAIVQIPLPTPGDIATSLTGPTDGSSVGSLLTKNSQVYRIIQSAASTNLTPITPADGQFASGNAVTTYNGNLYLLDGTAGQLLRYANTGTAFGRGTSSISSAKYDMKNGISLAIDGSIYLLASTGNVQKFSGGQPDPAFALRNLPPGSLPLAKPLQILTDADATGLYLLAGGTDAKLIELSKEGTFVQSFGFPKNIGDVKAVNLDLGNKTVWLLSGSTIKKFLLP